MAPIPMTVRPRSRTGLNALKARVKIRGLSAIDIRTLAGRALVEWRRELLEALGGEGTVSPQRRAIVDVIVRTKLYIDSLDAWLVEQPSLIQKKRRAVVPVLKERQQLADSLTRQLAHVGLERLQRDVVPTLAELSRQAIAEGGQVPQDEPALAGTTSEPEEGNPGPPAGLGDSED